MEAFISKEKNPMNRDVILFYAAYFLMVFAKAFGLSTANRSYYVMFAVSAVLLAGRVLILKLDRKSISKLSLVLLPSVLIFLFSRETTLLFTSLFIVACAGIDFENCIKWCAKIYTVAILLKILLYFCGIVEGGYKPIYTHDSVGTPYLVGYTYGYGYDHPNMLFSAVFVAILLWLYIKRDELSWKVIGIATVVMTVLFLATRSRSGFLVYLSVLVALVIQKYYPQKKRLLKYYCFLLMGGTLIIGVLFPLIYTDENYIIFMANKMLSARPRWAHEALKMYGISLFGGEGVFLDNLYMDVLVNCGVVGFATLIVGIVILLRSFLRDKNTMGLVCTVSLILYAAMEQFPLNVGMNPFILYIGTDGLFFGEVKKKTEIEQIE